MPKPVTISIPRPCHEQWDEMAPTEHGRRCSNCQKTVIDFTVMTDGEIIETIRASANGFCGRFFNTQLERPIQPVAKPSLIKAFINKAAGVFLLAQIATEHSAAQQKNKQDTVLAPVDQQKKEDRKAAGTHKYINNAKESSTIVAFTSGTTLGVGTPLPPNGLFDRLVNYWKAKKYWR